MSVHKIVMVTLLMIRDHHLQMFLITQFCVKKKKLVKRFGAALVTVLGSQGIIILTCSKLVTALLFQDMTSFYCMLGTSQTVLGCQSELRVSLSTGHWAN